MDWWVHVETMGTIGSGDLTDAVQRALEERGVIVREVDVLDPEEAASALVPYGPWMEF